MVWFFFFLSASAELVLWSPGYEADERSLLGLNGLALPVADAARPFSCAAVCVQRSRDVGKAHTGHRKRVDTQNQSLKMPVTKTTTESCLRNQKKKDHPSGGLFFFLSASAELVLWSPGYKTQTGAYTGHRNRASPDYQIAISHNRTHISSQFNTYICFMHLTLFSTIVIITKKGVII